jgi:SOS-response transcriptional repressor LexA
VRYNPVVNAQVRITPTMRSRRLIALDFIKRYWAEWGDSPSLSEIAAKLDITRQRANQLVDQLVEQGLILRTPGKRRGLSLVERPPISRADALLALRELGVKMDQDFLRTGLEPLTNNGLALVPELDHDPALDVGVGFNDSDIERPGITG